PGVIVIHVNNERTGLNLTTRRHRHPGSRTIDRVSLQHVQLQTQSQRRRLEALELESSVRLRHLSADNLTSLVATELLDVSITTDSNAVSVEPSGVHESHIGGIQVARKGSTQRGDENSVVVRTKDPGVGSISCHDLPLLIR